MIHVRTCMNVFDIAHVHLTFNKFIFNTFYARLFTNNRVLLPIIFTWREIDRFRGIGPHTFTQQILNVASNVSIIITPNRHEMTLYALFYLNQKHSHIANKRKIYCVVKVGQMCSLSYWIFLVRLYCIQIATTIFVLKHLKFVKKFSVSNAMW